MDKVYFLLPILNRIIIKRFLFHFRVIRFAFKREIQRTFLIDGEQIVRLLGRSHPANYERVRDVYECLVLISNRLLNSLSSAISPYT